MKRARTGKKPARRAAPKRKAKAKPARTPAKRAPAKRVAAKRTATPTRPAKRPTKKPARRTAKKPAKRGSSDAKWVAFVERHGVVLASARGPVPSVAEAIANEPIIGSWWSHPKAQTIFDALSAIDDSDDIRCFKLVDKKITFVHRRLWPALVKLAQTGVLGADRVESIQQEHMPTGEHRNFMVRFPDWVPDKVAAAAATLTIAAARTQLGPWL